MKLKVYVIDLEMSRRTKRALLVGGVFGLLLTAGAVAYAAMLPAPYPLQTNALLRASDLNTLFGNLDTRLDDIEARTTLVRFCGATTAQFTGTIGGYGAVKSACSAPCNSTASAHMCTSSEIAIIAQSGALPAGWFTGGTGFPIGGNTATQDDCTGWTTSSASYFAPAWNSGAYPSNAPCNSTLPILCCS